MTYLIGLGGPSTSGKTTVGNLLVQKLRDDSLRVESISLDYFYRNRSEWPRVNGWVNPDSPKSLDWEAFHLTLSEIRSGSQVAVDVYEKNSSISLRSGMQVDESRSSRMIRPSDVVIVEGFLLYLRPDVRDLLDLKLYFDIDQETQRERRIRTYNNPDAMEYFDDVLMEMQRKFVDVTRVHADELIDTGLTTPEEAADLAWKIIKERLNLKAKK